MRDFCPAHLSVPHAYRVCYMIYAHLVLLICLSLERRLSWALLRSILLKDSRTDMIKRYLLMPFNLLIKVVIFQRVRFATVFLLVQTNDLQVLTIRRLCSLCRKSLLAAANSIAHINVHHPSTFCVQSNLLLHGISKQGCANRRRTGFRTAARPVSQERKGRHLLHPCDPVLALRYCGPRCESSSDL